MGVGFGVPIVGGMVPAGGVGLVEAVAVLAVDGVEEPVA